MCKWNATYRQQCSKLLYHAVHLLLLDSVLFLICLISAKKTAMFVSAEYRWGEDDDPVDVDAFEFVATDDEADPDVPDHDGVDSDEVPIGMCNFHNKLDMCTQGLF